GGTCGLATPGGRLYFPRRDGNRGRRSVRPPYPVRRVRVHSHGEGRTTAGEQRTARRLPEALGHSSERVGVTGAAEKAQKRAVTLSKVPIVAGWPVVTATTAPNSVPTGHDNTTRWQAALAG
ncbi:MAG: hypothetical protein U0531_22180, partial [Dehalococcoidia bacterium]